MVNVLFFSYQISIFGLTDKSIFLISPAIFEDTFLGFELGKTPWVALQNGEYIYFLDSDDFIHPQLLDICHTLAEKENADMVSFSFQHFSNEKEINVLPYNIDKVDSYITNINYDISKSRIELLINVCWSGQPILKEDNNTGMNVTKVEAVNEKNDDFSTIEMNKTNGFIKSKEQLEKQQLMILLIEA